MVVVSGYSILPGCCSYQYPEGPGKNYVVRYNWDERALDVIQYIYNNALLPPGHLWKLIAQDMLSSKIGATSDFNDRISKYIWAQCFADIRFLACANPLIRQEEMRLHNTRWPFWSGIGESGLDCITGILIALDTTLLCIIWNHGTLLNLNSLICVIQVYMLEFVSVETSSRWMSFVGCTY